MIPHDIFALLESKVAPVALSDELCAKYGAYDNSGIILNCGKKVRSALFALDLSVAAVKRAEELGYDLIVTHHPAIYAAIKRVDCACGSPTEALAMCAMRGISVISMHLNFDAAPRGIDYYLMRGLGGEREEAVCQPLTSGGYGRVYSVPAQSFESFKRGVEKTFESGRIRFYDSGRKVSKVASFCGAGCDDETMAFAVSHGADTFVSADMKHHQIAALVSLGLNVVEMTHYCSEIYGFGRIYDGIREELGIPSEFFKDGALL